MNRNISVTTYFEEHASKSGRSDKVRSRAVDALLKSGVASMCALTEKDAMWIFSLLLNEKEELDEECHDFVREMQHKYLVAVQKAGLLAAGIHGVGSYFKEHSPKAENLTNRAVNALQRANIETMHELCAASQEELEGVRNLGALSLELTLLMRRRYAKECGVAVKENN